MILIISYMSSFEINKVNPFPAQIATFPFIFLSNLYYALKVELLANSGKLSIIKGIVIFVSAFFPKLPNQEAKNLPDLIILDIWALLSFISVEILLAKTFLILVLCLVVRNIFCGNFSSSRFFLFNVNIFPVLFLAADYALFNCVFASLTLTSSSFAIFYNTVTLPWENFNLLSLVYFNIVKTNMGLFATTTSCGFFNCLKNYFYLIAFESVSNSFCLLDSTAINL